jgi:colicin import membrane protein
MRILYSAIISLLIHGIVFSAVLFGTFQGTSPPVDLGQPAYEVELVSAPEPEPEPEPEEQPRESEEAEPKKEQAQDKEQVSQGPEAAKARKSSPEQSRAEKVPRKSRAPERKREKAEKRRAPDKGESRKKPEAPRTPTGDTVLDKALQDLQKDVDTEREQERIIARELENLRKKQSAARSSKASSRQEKKLYASLVEQRIKRNWRFPPVGGEGSFSAEVRVRLKPNGEIADYMLVSGSGRSDFDDSVLRAVEETVSLPEPPEELDTISITFNLQELRR